MARPRDTIEAEIAELKRLAAKRRGKPGFAQNVALIDEKIADAEAELAEVEDSA